MLLEFGSDVGAALEEVQELARDDGAGFSPGAVRAGAGFMNMRDRVEAVGGELAIVSSPGRGTRVTARIPLGPKAR